MRLIDADAIKWKSHWWRYASGEEYEWEIIDKATIDNAPTIEAEPVKHGEWEAHKKTVGEMMYIKGMKCSECNHTYTIRGDWNYCPNCGAKMDKEKEDDNGD